MTDQTERGAGHESEAPARSGSEVDVVTAVVGRVGVALVRFVVGRPVCVPRTRWSSGWLRAAPPPPPLAGAGAGSLRAVCRAEGVPFSRWLRRPGWQRQCTRMAAVAAAVSPVAPWVGMVALGLAAVAAGAAWVATGLTRVAVTRLGHQRIADALDGAATATFLAITGTERAHAKERSRIHVDSERVEDPEGEWSP